MDKRTLAIAVAMSILVAGTAFGQANAPAIDNAPTSETTPTGRGSPTIAPQSANEHNPAVNPNAAGIQRGWRGYGSSQQQPAPKPGRKNRATSWKY